MEKPTSAAPITVDGVTFRCYRTGIQRFAWKSADGRLSVQRNHNADTHCASVDGNAVPGANPHRAKRFRTQRAAMAAAVLASNG